ncbi:MAG: hypothetical protein JNM31_04405 [Flavobacteriales bacterium]|nr:hypothetical protein [Flavobacteriales bacterium]
MKPHLTFSSGSLPFLLLLCSCSHYAYMPNMHQVPLLREKGEVRVAVCNSSEDMGNSEVTGMELQFSGAITDHWGLMLNLASYASRHGDGTGRFAELGAGRFRKLDPHWTLEWYAGVGRGASNYDSQTLNLWRLFAQPSIGYASRNFDIAFTTRFVLVDHDLPSFPTYSPLGITESVADLVHYFGKARGMVEPGFLMRLGGRAVKLQIQYVHSINLGRELYMLENNVSLGLQFNFNNSFLPRWKKTLPDQRRAPVPAR